MAEESDLPQWLNNLQSGKLDSIQIENEAKGVWKPRNCNSGLERVFEGQVVNGRPFCLDQNNLATVTDMNCQALCLKRRV